MSDPRNGGPGHDVRDELPLLALNAIDDRARTRLESHLADCPDCLREFQDYQRITGELRGVLQQPPPGAVWEGIQERLHGPQNGVVSRRAWRWSFRSWAIAGAAVLAVLAFGFLVGVMVGDRGDDAATSPILPGGPSENSVYTLTALEPSSAAFGRAFMSSDGRRGVVAVAGLTQLPADQAYAVWLVRDGAAPESIGTFEVDAAGNAVAALWLPDVALDWEDEGHALALTISPVSLADPSVPAGAPLLIAPIY